MGSCSRSPKLTQPTLGPRSLARLIIHSQFLFLWFGMPGMPMVKPLGLACRACQARNWHAQPSETDFDDRFSIISWESHTIAKYILGSLKLQVSCLAINADYNKKSHVCHNVCHGIDWQNWRQKPGFINKKHNKTTLFMHKIEYLTCNQRSILLFQTDTDISGSRFKFDRGKAF